MRILLVSKRFDFGGTENHVCDLANSLSDLGHNVILLAAKGRQASRLDPKIVFVPYLLRDFLFPINIVYIYFIIKKHGVEVIHAHQRTAIFYSAIVSRLTKIPLIATIHGRTRLDLRSRFSRNTSDRLIFVSKHVLQVSACYEQIKGKSIVIPNGVELSNASNVTVPYSISYVSRIDKKHSKVILMMIQEVLPKLIVEIPQITFNIVGEGDGLKIIRSEADNLNVKANRKVCNVLGFQPEVKELFQKSSLVLGVGRVALEALACGVPVLSINQNRLGTIITSSNYAEYKLNNFIAVHSNAPKPMGIEREIIDFFKNVDTHFDEVKILQTFISEDFNIQTLTKQIANTYIDAINSKKID